MPKPIIFWGAAGQAKVLAEFMEAGGYRLCALFDNNSSQPSPIAGIPLHFGREGFESWRRSCPQKQVYGLVAVGGSRGRERYDLQQYLEANEIKIVTVIHPGAIVASNAQIDAGSQILAGAVVCAESVLGKACIVNTGASVDHECCLQNGVHIGPGTVLSGCVLVGEYTFIGAGAVILPRIKIGRNVIVGAGSVVTRDIPDGCVAYGNPARVKRQVSV